MERLNRRELFSRLSLLGLPALFSGKPSPAMAASPGLRPGPDVYQSIGVRPLINAHGTFTIISGSLMLPEVRAAIDAAAQRHVHLDELMDAIGARIEGTHQGDFVSRDVTGRVEGDAVRMRSSYTEEHGDSLVFNFSGKLSGEEMSGTLDMGEYLMGRWTARRHRYPNA